MTLTLYNLRADGDEWRITKFIDGEVEASYLTSHSECTCPAGSRPTCRHRQMLPDLLDRHMADSDLFWHFDGRFSCDINGVPARHTVEQTVEPAPFNITATEIDQRYQSSVLNDPLTEYIVDQTYKVVADLGLAPSPAPTPKPFRRRL